MNKIQELITKLCSDGVAIKTLGELCNISAGGDAPKEAMSKEKNQEYNIPIVSNGIKENAIYGYTNTAKIFEPAVTVAARGTIGYAEYRDYPYFPIIRLLSLTPKNKKELNVKFLYYSLEGKNYKIPMSGIPQLTAPTLKKIEIAVPPLEVQREIVHVLDYFTLLTAELTAELTARKKQYEFYRDKLLSHDGNYPMKPLAELGKWSGGKTPSMSDKNFWENGTIPWISSKDMKSPTLVDTQDHITEKAVKEASMTVYPVNSIAVVTRSGILKHTFPVAYVPFETTINQDIKMLVVNEDVLPRYAFHVIQGKASDILVKTKKQGGTVDSLDFQKVLAYKVPVPSKDVQGRLVEVLDNFENICTDLNIGLPAEIEARQKQYEYYRDLLLTFAETGSMLMTDRQTDRQTDRAERN